MYEDAWYNAFVPGSRSQDLDQRPKHSRRESLLKQPEEERLFTVPVGGRTEIPEEPEDAGPPKATVQQRAKSYSDFYDIVRAHLKKGRKDEGAKEPLQTSTQLTPSSLSTELEYRRWYEGLQDELATARHSHYQSHRDKLRLSQAHLGNLLDDSTSTLKILSSLAESFREVEVQTDAFRAQCQGLISDQTRLSRLADDIGTNLGYYDYLEPITRRLNAPGAGSFVRGREFSEMLSNLDKCLDFMHKHPEHKEAQSYRSRYRLLMTRALTLVRVHFVTSIREISADVSRRIAERQLNDTTLSTLLYAKFKVGAKDLKHVGQEIRKRADSSDEDDTNAENEYQTLMNELYQSFSASRAKMVIPLVRKRLTEISLSPGTAKDLVKFARQSIGYIRSICYDEYELWGEWFEGDEGVYTFLEAICEPLYDHLRPKIIHENQLLKLCELCTLIQTRYMQDQEEESETVNVSQVDFAALIQPALEDAQTRLVFRTQAILRDEIESFKPKPADLDYPARARGVALSGTRKKSTAPAANGSTAAAGKEAESGDEKEQSWVLDGERAGEGQYPTLRKAIWLLSRIYKLVNSTVFDDLAHQIVHQTTLSLQRASVQIGGSAKKVDGQLFLIKHLLQLKAQIVAFDIEFVTPEVAFDFSSVTNTFWELRERGGLFNPRNLVRFVGGGLLPRVVENMLDAKVELDGRLRTVINDLVKDFSQKMSSPIAGDAAKKRTFKGGPAVESVRERAEKEMPILRSKLDEYLDDARTKDTLVGAVLDQLLQDYEDFWTKYTESTKTNGQAISHKGKGREDGVWDLETFAEWAEGVFKVGLAAQDDYSGADGESRSVSPTDSM